ncbi:hypothetical protein TNCV_2978851 [Trichonephila clavipes]|nr:hypothetical protein TNCV_2978851 [Trichonephila clavipes]
MNWPPRSCDLTPLDYFLWVYVKSLVYADKPQTLDHLEDNIRRVITDIRPQMLEKVIENWTSRLDYIRASRGSPMPEIIFKIEVKRFLQLYKGKLNSGFLKRKSQLNAGCLREDYASYKKEKRLPALLKFDRGRIGAYREYGLAFQYIATRFARNPLTVMRVWIRWAQDSLLNAMQHLVVANTREDRCQVDFAGLYGHNTNLSQEAGLFAAQLSLPMVR